MRKFILFLMVMLLTVPALVMGGTDRVVLAELGTATW